MDEFIQLLRQRFFFLRVRPSREDLIEIFKLLDSNQNGYISYSLYFSFVKKEFGEGYELPDDVWTREKSLCDIDTSTFFEERHSKVPATITREEWVLINSVWGELRSYFYQFDNGNKGYLRKEELKGFIMAVLSEASQN